MATYITNKFICYSFLEYNDNIKAYRLFNPYSKKIVINKDVIVNKSILKIKQIMQPKQLETYIKIQLEFKNSNIHAKESDLYLEVENDI